MIQFRKVLRTVLLVTISVLLFVAGGLQAEPNDDVRLRLRVGDVYTYPGQQNVSIPVYLTNYSDTVIAFDVKLRADQFDLASWRTGVDTVSTLTSDWYAIQSIFVGMGASILRVVAQTQAPFGGGGEPLFPQEETIPAFRVHIDAAMIDDTVSERETQMRLLHQPADNLVIVDNHTGVIGLAYEHYLDSNYYRCDIWDEIFSEDCLSWSRVSGPPYDSIAIFPDSLPYIDTNLVKIEAGTITIVRCGNFDGSADNKVNLADITSMIAYVYLNGDDPPVLRSANVDASANGAVNLADITKLIGHVYLGSGPLSCE